jgi:hypothetical protein
VRTLLYQAMKTDLAGHPSGVGNRIHQISSLGQGDGAAQVPPAPEKPFLIVRQMITTRYRDVRETSRSERQSFQIYCYDHRGSYVQIDEILRSLQPTVERLEGVRSPTGAFCFQAEWLGLSQDYTDEQYDAIVRFANDQMSA